MKRDSIWAHPALSRLSGLLVVIVAFAQVKAEVPAGAVAAFNSYAAATEVRLGRQHGSPEAFLAGSDRMREARLRRGDVVVEDLTCEGGLAVPGALLHHWRGTAFVDGGRAGAFERVMRDFDSYPLSFAPQVLRAEVVKGEGDRVTAAMRVEQTHLLTVVMDTVYDVTFGRLDPRHGFSISRSTHISEIASLGTSREHVLSAAEEHGFLWRQNTYWSYEQRDEGLYLQIESISLSRAIPTGLGWVVRPFVESVPRDSLEFTLRATRKALKKDSN